MKPALRRLAQRLPVVGTLLVQRHAWRLRLRALLRTLRGGTAWPGPAARLDPVFTSTDRRSYVDACAGADLPDPAQRYPDPVTRGSPARFQLRRFCLCCGEMTAMRVDCAIGYVQAGGAKVPNWRERLTCSGCGMNNRQRLIAALLAQCALELPRPRICLTEQVTPIFHWAQGLPGAEVHGSEYLGPQYRAGERIRGVRHEDAMALSYPDAYFDVIVSNDVLEHIPDPARALREAFRVLKPGGTLLATFPFHVDQDQTVQRARLEGDRVEHLLPPQYHGNPVAPEGSLVFNDFGWDLLDVARDAGLSPALEVYCSDEFGHLGTGLVVFRLRRPTPDGPRAGLRTGKGAVAPGCPRERAR